MGETKVSGTFFLFNGCCLPCHAWQPPILSPDSQYGIPRHMAFRPLAMRPCFCGFPPKGEKVSGTFFLFNGCCLPCHAWQRPILSPDSQYRIPRHVALRVLFVRPLSIAPCRTRHSPLATRHSSLARRHLASSIANPPRPPSSPFAPLPPVKKIPRSSQRPEPVFLQVAKNYL